ncbi:MAG: hypothetical protein R3B57_04985 [Phycisphaerales bacterium]
MTPHEEIHASDSGIAPGFLRRLAVYLFGVAIGLMLLGLFQQLRGASSPPTRGQGAAQTPGDGAPTPADAPESTPRPGDEQGG